MAASFIVQKHKVEYLRVKREIKTFEENFILCKLDIFHGSVLFLNPKVFPCNQGPWLGNTFEDETLDEGS